MVKDNRLNRYETKIGPVKEHADIEFGSSEYARAFSLSSSKAQILPVVVEQEQRPVNNNVTIMKETVSDNILEQKSKTNYSRSMKPLWILNKYKSGFDLKYDPDAKFEATTCYMDSFSKKSDLQSSTKKDSRIGITTATKATQSDISDSLEEDDSNHLTTKKEEIPDNNNKGDDGNFQEKAKAIDKDKTSHILMPPPSSANKSTQSTESILINTLEDFTTVTSSDYNYKRIEPHEHLYSPRYSSRRNLLAEPLILSTPGMKYFINSISRR